MKVSRRWLEDFLKRPLSIADLRGRLAMLGAPVDAVESLAGELAPVVVGLVEAAEPHPNADRLRVCQVAIGGGERRQVVTGAPNVEAGRRYPFAGVGVTLPNGLTLEKRKLRGEISEGMLCSEIELGLGADADGLMTLETEADPGTPLVDVLGLDDDRLELDLAPVRGDLLGHKGIARELAASLGVIARLPVVPDAPAELPPFRRSETPLAAGGVEIRIAPGSAGRRFTAAVIEGVTVGPSPAWLARRLEAVGQRPINNVVDVTNYVMFELGQPLHAYDGAKLRGGVLESRLARSGERLRTLDEVERALAPTMTVVADAEGPVGVAGVMGGLESEVTDATTTVVLEAAWWDPIATRSTRRALGLPSEASQRFERGPDLWALPDALRRAVEVLLATAGGRVVEQPIDLWPEPGHPPRIFLRVSRVAQILGIELGMGEIERTLTAIGATVSPKPEDGRLAVDVPGWRGDLTSEIDLIEEVARIHGYDRLPDELRPYRIGAQIDPPLEARTAAIRRAMMGLGLHEAITLPIGPATGPGSVPLQNPLTADHAFLRDRLSVGLVRQVEANWANQVRDVRLFEIGTAFGPGGPGRRPVESCRIAAVLTGGRRPAHWTDGGETPDLDWWDLKGLFERAASLANPGASVQVQDGSLVARSEQGAEIGRAGPLGADSPAWAGPLFGFEIEIAERAASKLGFEPLPTVPASSRDLALVVPWSIESGRVVETMREAGTGLLESVSVVDEYRGAGLPDGTRSVAYRLVFRGRDRTLRDRDVEGVMKRIQRALESQLGVGIRAS
ncbi:MAG: phenylalanine--tRNA ligase subunit beta [Gemmatimonadales bacterium]